jgi:streptogramin lyase
MGVSESDFADAGTGSCTTNGISVTYGPNAVCTMDVYFTPSTWGPRYGAVELRDDAGEVMAIGYVYGTGIAPLATFAVPYQSAAGSGFSNLTGLAMDGFGDIFVADDANNTVKEIEPSGTVDPVMTANGPYAIAMDGGGNLFLAEDQVPTSIFEFFEIGGFTSFKQLATSFAFNYISGLAVDGNGNVFAADYLGGAVYEITASSGYADVKTLPAGSVTPYGIAVDVNGNVYFTDAAHDSVDEIPAPDYSTVKVLNSTFSTPWGIAVDGNGNLFVADYGDNSLKELMASGGYKTVNTLASNVTGIQAVVLDPAGKVYYTVNAGASVTRLDYTAWPDLDFPATALGSTSITQTVTMNNSGNQWLYFLAVGYPQHFPETFPANDECYTGGYVPAGGSCTVSVAFAPRALGNLNASVVLVDNSLYPAWEAYQKIDVFGKGLSTQSIAFTDSLPASANYSVGLTYALSANGGGSGNPVIFSLVSGPATVAGSTLTITGAGTVVVAANQAGNASYAAAPQVTQTIVIKLGSQTISFPAITATEYAGTQMTLSATASSGLAVSFTSSTPTVCTVSGSTASLLVSGTCIVRANQSGSAIFAAAQFVQQIFTVHVQSQTISFPAITATQYISSTLPLTATTTSGLAVTYTSVTTSVCTVSGSTASLIALGACVIHATQPGNAVYAMAQLVSQSFIVHLNPQTISFPAITATQYAASNLTLSATASSGLTVSFTSTTPTICTVTGTTAKLLIAGTCILQAAQTGNANYAAAAIVQQNIAVHLAPQTITFPAIASQIVGANVTLGATASSGLAVSYTSATTSVCTVAGSTATMVSAGACVIHATQAGNNVYAAAPLVSKDITVKAS